MDSEIIKLAASQGLWATMSVFLLFYILKNQEKRDLKQEEREKNYQDIILKLSVKLEALDEVKLDLQEIKKHICR